MDTSSILLQLLHPSPAAQDLAAARAQFARSSALQDDVQAKAAVTGPWGDGEGTIR